MNNDLEQYTVNKIKQLTMAIDQSAFTAIRDGLIKEKAMAEIALKAMQEKPLWQGAFIMQGHYYSSGSVTDNQFKFVSVDGGAAAVTLDISTVKEFNPFPANALLNISVGEEK